MRAPDCGTGGSARQAPRPDGPEVGSAGDESLSRACSASAGGGLVGRGGGCSGHGGDDGGGPGERVPMPCWRIVRALGVPGRGPD